MLEVKDLTIGFRSADGDIIAVESVSFSMGEGETLAIVGESGSGKSVTALALTRLLPAPPAYYKSGDILLEGRSVLAMSENTLRSIRGNQVAYIFQEPATSLNPVFSIYEQIAETIRLHRPKVREVRKEVVHWLDQVGIVDPAKRLRDYPFQLSGGMQQRVMIAMALCCQPKILIADEPTTALDVTIQRQILDLFRALKKQIPDGDYFDHPQLRYHSRLGGQSRGHVSRPVGRVRARRSRSAPASASLYARLARLRSKVRA